MTRGFTALVSVVLIAGFLLAATASASYAGFYARSSMLAYETREAGRLLARACAESVRLRLLYEPQYAGADRYALDTGAHCSIGEIDRRVRAARSFPDYQFTVTVDVSYMIHSITFEIVVEGSSMEVEHMREIPSSAT